MNKDKNEKSLKPESPTFEITSYGIKRSMTTSQRVELLRSAIEAVKNVTVEGKEPEKSAH